MRRLATLAAALAIPASAQAADPVPADPAQVLAGVASCVAATAGGTLDRAQIEAEGWALGRIVGGNGADLANTLEMRSRPGSPVLMTTPAGEDLCIIVSRVADEPAVAAIRARLLATYPGTPQAMQQAGDVWPSGNHILSFAWSGQVAAPSVRIIVKGKGAN